VAVYVGDAPIQERIRELAAAGLIDSTMTRNGDQVEWVYAPNALANNHWLGLAPEDIPAEMLRDPGLEPEYSSPALSIEFAKDARGGSGKLPVGVTLGGMDVVRPIEMPELVRIAKELTGQIPTLRKMPKAAGNFRAAGGQCSITLDPRIFTDQDSAARVLAHEIGHLYDYLPDKRMDRGNIFGRIGTLVDWLATTFPIKPTTPLSQVLTPLDRQRLKAAAAKKVGARPERDNKVDLAAWRMEVASEYAEMVVNECERRGLAQLDEVRQELIDLTGWWHPYDAYKVPEAYVKYRQSSKELYADAMSVMMCAPVELADRAPLFQRMFYDYLDRKPEVLKQLVEVQELLAKGKIPTIERREGDIADAFKRGEEIMKEKALAREQRRRSFKGFISETLQALYDSRYPVGVKARQAEKTRYAFTPDNDPRILFEEEWMTGNTNSRLFKRVFETVVKPIEDLGISTGDLGKYMMYQRVLHERSGLANPWGLTPKAAREGLLKMRLELGAHKNQGVSKITLLEAAAKRFHEIVYDVMREGAEVGAISKQTMDEIIEPNKYHYAAFAVLDYLEDYIPATIRQQVGTLKDIGNPFTATLCKTMAMVNLIAIQRSKIATLKLLTECFPAEVKPAETRWDGQKHVAIPDPDHGVFTLMVNGSQKHWYVDPLIAESFERATPGKLEKICRVLDWPFRTLFYPVWITYSAGFTAANLMRDFSRTRKAIGAMGSSKGMHAPGFPAIAMEYFKQLPAAYRRSAGKPDPLIAEMLENFAISLPELDSSRSIAPERDDYLADLGDKYRYFPAARKGWTPPAAIQWPLGKIKLAASIVESVSKIAGYKLLRTKLKMQPGEAAAVVRRYVGTPFTMRRGSLAAVPRALVPFWNVFIQGAVADAKLLTDPKTASGWWWRWANTDGLIAVFAGLAASGALGAVLKSLYDGISEYVKTNYNVVPMGTVPGGEYGQKVLALTLPRDETSRFLSGVTYKAIRALYGQPKALQQVFAFGEGQVPGINPVISIVKNWNDYAQGQNPMDDFRSRNIVPPREWEAGGWYSMKPMLAWTYNQTGLQDYLRYNPGDNTTVEVSVNQVPVVSRFLRLTDAGYREQANAAITADRQSNAVHSLTLPAEVQKLEREYQRLARIPVRTRTIDQAGRLKDLQEWRRRHYNDDNAAVRRSESAGDAAEAVRLRQRMADSVEDLAR
jgi:hypothetical protein